MEHLEQQYKIGYSKHNPSNKRSFYLCFYLPLGKEFFGFAGWRNSTLNMKQQHLGTSFFEHTVVRYFRQAFKLNEDVLPGDGRAENIEPLNANPSLRALTLKFKYETPQNAVNYFDLSKGEKIDVTFTMYSNGLYLWQFTSSYNPSKFPDNRVDPNVRNFLRYDFIPNYLSVLFNLKWAKRPATVADVDGFDKPDIDKYIKGNGCLNFYQMDQIFNGLFNVNVVPEVAFAKRDDFPRQLINFCRSRYSLESIIRNLSLVVTEEEGGGMAILPLEYAQRTRLSTVDDEENISINDIDDIPFGNGDDWEKRAPNYTARVLDPDMRIKWSSILSDSNDPIEDHKYSGTDTSLRGYFRSRLLFAALEHFCRAATTYAISEYRRGSAYCRERFVHEGAIKRHNRGAGQMLAPTIHHSEKLHVTIHGLEDYQSLLHSRVPLLKAFVQNVESMRKTSWPNHATKMLNSDETSTDLELISYFEEWEYSRSKLNGAVLQIKRNVEALEDELDSINRSLQSEQNDRTSEEQTRTRRALEVRSEVRRREEQDLAFTNKLAFFAVLLTLALFFVGLLPWAVQLVIDIKLEQSKASSISTTPLHLFIEALFEPMTLLIGSIAIFGTFSTFAAYFLWRNWTKSGSNYSKKTYDYPYLRLALEPNAGDILDQIDTTVHKLREGMFDLGYWCAFDDNLSRDIPNERYSPKNTVDAADFEDLVAPPSAGVHRFTYSFESSSFKSGRKPTIRWWNAFSVWRLTKWKMGWKTKEKCNYSLQIEIEYLPATRTAKLSSMRFELRHPRNWTTKEASLAGDRLLEVLLKFLVTGEHGSTPDSLQGAVLWEVFAIRKFKNVLT